MLCNIRIFRFESLLTDEGNLAHEIEIIEARIQNLASATVETTSSKPISARTSKGSTLPPEVKAFEVQSLPKSFLLLACLFPF